MKLKITYQRMSKQMCLRTRSVVAQRDYGYCCPKRSQSKKLDLIRTQIRLKNKIEAKKNEARLYEIK